MFKQDYSEEELREVLKGFGVANVVSAVRYGSGHINVTFKVDCSDGKSYILQRINTDIFAATDEMMENIKRVTEHLRSKGERTLEVLGYSKPWRLYNFIGGAHTVDVISNLNEAGKAAKTFGRFQNLLADLPEPRLHEVLKNFHNTISRLEQFDAALAADVKGRRADVAAEIEFVDAHREEAGRVVQLMKSGAIPERITHNDTKINNVMLSDATDEGVAVIDLDTVMPGSALYDFGDMVRTATANAAEDEKDLSKVFSRRDFFEALTRAYVSEAAFLNEAERENLAFSGRLITFTIGLRFLTDYLAGDVYFHTAYGNHNLVRCRTQFKMVETMEAQRGEYERIVKDAWLAAGRLRG